MPGSGSLLEPSTSLLDSASIAARLGRSNLAFEVSVSNQSAAARLAQESHSNHGEAAFRRLAAKVAQDNVRYLESLLAIACTWEVLTDAGMSAEQYGWSALRTDVLAKCGLDPVTAIESARSYFFSAQQLDAARARGLHERAIVPVTAFVRHLRSQIESYPIDIISKAAEFAGRLEYASRAQIAYRGLKLFLLRCDPELHSRLDALGDLYQIGRLSLPQVADILQESTTDAVALLEARGFGRPISELTLDDKERVARLRAIRNDRLSRSGVRRTFERYAERSAIASERIEGVDARPWLLNQNRPE